MKVANYEDLSQYSSTSDRKKNLLERRDKAYESFNGGFPHFRLSDNFYDEAGIHLEKRFGRICNYYSGFVSVVKFQILNSPLFCCVCKRHATKAEMVTGAVVNVLMI